MVCDKRGYYLRCNITTKISQTQATYEQQQQQTKWQKANKEGSGMQKPKQSRSMKKASLDFSLDRKILGANVFIFRVYYW